MKTYHVLVPEYVPLANKGEEAIVRGIADSLFPYGNCEVHLFEMDAKDYRCHDGIHVYPGSWFFPVWVTKEFGLKFSWQKLRDSSCSVLRHILNRAYPNWVKQTPASLLRTAAILNQLNNGNPPRNEKEKQLRQLLDCDFIIAGHDGGLNEWVCHVVRTMRESFNKYFGVYGVQLKRAFGSQAILAVHASEFRHSLFFFCRDTPTAEGVRRNFPFVSPQVAPDPAFAMRPADRQTVDSLISREGLTTFFQKPVVMCTCCEPAPIARHCFDRVVSPEGKLRAHRELFARLIRHIIEKYDVNILFLPHALGPGIALDDRLVAKDILKRAQLPSDRARVLETEYGARDLKGLIGNGAFLVAERIHSIIGATGVTTPFLCLGSRKDVRVSGIVQEMLDLPQAVYHLHEPVEKDLHNKFDQLWKQRDSLKAHLTVKSTQLMSELADAAKVIRDAFSIEDGSR
jgi:hypothetical protein